MSPAVAWAVIIGMAVTNFLVRFLPISILSRVRLPEPVQRWLSFVPVSVMAALVSVSVLRPEGEWLLTPANPYLIASVPTAVVYGKTRSFLGAVVAGLLTFLAVRTVLG